MESIPTATKWTVDAAGKTGRIAVESVFLIYATKTSKKGTGFLLTNGKIITNEHVVRNNSTEEIVALSSSAKKIEFSDLILDTFRDLAILTPKENLDGGLELGNDNVIKIGTMVSTWGFPLMYNGPSPLLSVGFLSEFKEYHEDSGNVKHLVINGAFNPGNSGGPLFESNDNKIIGIVASTHAPLNETRKSLLEQLQNNRSGVVFHATDEKGNDVQLVESQIIADWLYYLRSLTQVMIGEAISVQELKNFLEENDLLN